jgi:anti-sigma regulatory factor (Ser/Thr protein kinase)
VDRQRFETFERDSREVARARQVVRETLKGWRLDADLADVELLVSELVSNAVRHGSGPIRLRLFSEGPTLRVEVVDGGGRRPLTPAGAPQAGGIGLHLVDQLTDSWGLHRDDHKTMAWVVKRTSARRANGSNGHAR